MPSRHAVDANAVQVKAVEAAEADEDRATIVPVAVKYDSPWSHSKSTMKVFTLQIMIDAWLTRNAILCRPNKALRMEAGEAVEADEADATIDTRGLPSGRGHQGSLACDRGMRLKAIEGFEADEAAKAAKQRVRGTQSHHDQVYC